MSLEHLESARDRFYQSTSPWNWCCLLRVLEVSCRSPDSKYPSLIPQGNARDRAQDKKPIAGVEGGGITHSRSLARKMSGPGPLQVCPSRSIAVPRGLLKVPT